MKLLTIRSSIAFFFFLISCANFSTDKRKVKQSSWKGEFNQQLSYFGHRNWILIVDKAFPMQNSSGMIYLDTEENLLPTLQYVMDQINRSPHVKPIFYIDKELSCIVPEQVTKIEAYRDSLFRKFNHKLVQTLYHDSIFTHMNQASQLFKVMVLKTNETIPYSSVFIQLDCKYWDSEREGKLRTNMSNIEYKN